jgi:hypothetical protein
MTLTLETRPSIHPSLPPSVRPTGAGLDLPTTPGGRPAFVSFFPAFFLSFFLFLIFYVFLAARLPTTTLAKGYGITVWDKVSDIGDSCVLGTYWELWEHTKPSLRFYFFYNNVIFSA